MYNDDKKEAYYSSSVKDWLEYKPWKTIKYKYLCKTHPSINNLRILNIN